MAKRVIKKGICSHCHEEIEFDHTFQRWVHTDGARVMCRIKRAEPKEEVA